MRTTTALLACVLVAQACVVELVPPRLPAGGQEGADAARDGDGDDDDDSDIRVDDDDVEAVDGDGPAPWPTCDETKGPVGVSPLRRLNRFEVQHAIVDVFGVDAATFAAELPGDERIGAFSSNVAAVASPAVIEQLLAVARIVADDVMAEPGASGCAIIDDACVARVITERGARLFRRPLRADEVDAFVALAAAERAAGGTATDALATVVMALVSSPHFLYHHEDVPTPGAAQPERLPGLALAARLAFFVWGSVPDDALLAAAPTLTDPAALEAELGRLLADPRAARMMSSFVDQWLDLERLSHLDNSPTAQAALVDTAALGAALRTQTHAFFADVVAGQGNLRDLFTQAAPVPEALRGVCGDAPRAGLLAQGAWLAAFAHGGQASPTQRGKWVRENLLCQTMPLPPDDADTTPPPPVEGAISTTRDRMSALTADARCQACHRMMDGIGFAFEGYDPIGRARSHDAGLPVDASASVLFAYDADGEVTGAEALTSSAP